ncbi:hypothetical protein CMI47_11930 [Candidatus Pacearchaeota archaeon]|nr:hypothetical protein [Candidatus Pacearchaeota archaeon]|tara:strand:+ start:1422 stop:1799 length:378 start_codon:yes stop_codon:yes gene_type:complete
MAYTTIEIMALIAIIATVVKLVAVAINQKAYMNFAKNIYSKPGLAKLVFVILAAIVLYYLVQSGVDIITILAVTLFVALLYGISFVNYIDDLLAKIDKVNIWKDHMIDWIIWIALIVWGAYVLFM